MLAAARTPGRSHFGCLARTLHQQRTALLGQCRSGRQPVSSRSWVSATPSRPKCTYCLQRQQRSHISDAHLLQTRRQLQHQRLGSNEEQELAASVKRARTRSSRSILRIAAWAVVGAAGTVYIVSHIEPAPYTGRKRLILSSPATDRQMGEIYCAQLKQELGPKILPPNHPASRTLRRIAQNLMRGILKEVPAAESWDWEFYVINDPANINAFALAGGKVFVFTGLFKVAPTEGLLAAVVGHEIGHALARHHAEQNVVQWFKSFMTVVALLVGVDMASINVLDWLASMGLQLPKSRKLELEADHIGMLLLARSCAYRPQESVEMLNRLRAATGDTGGVLARASSYFNTHPAGEDRVAAAIKQLPSALAEMKRSCPEYVHHLRGKAHAAQLPSATQIRAAR
eukprot:TRINITY_DN9534_c0_g1_i1.p1 TRINITY_DN9534_c0_g1~~TRINITY_DN9534_c0_g1_i1.p1  ORF type:complete len:400 (+),score=85.36 TRINITY_DN9534_c0_g1_i1:43-1242(+)